MQLNNLRDRLHRYLSRYDFVRKVCDEESKEKMSLVNAKEALYFRVEFDSVARLVQRKELLSRFQKRLMGVCGESVRIAFGDVVLSREQVLDTSNFIQLLVKNSVLSYDAWVCLGE